MINPKLLDKMSSAEIAEYHDMFLAYLQAQSELERQVLSDTPIHILNEYDKCRDHFYDNLKIFKDHISNQYRGVIQ